MQLRTPTDIRLLIERAQPPRARISEKEHSFENPLASSSRWSRPSIHALKRTVHLHTLNTCMCVYKPCVFHA